MLKYFSSTPVTATSTASAKVIAARVVAGTITLTFPPGSRRRPVTRAEDPGVLARTVPSLPLVVTIVLAIVSAAVLADITSSWLFSITRHSLGKNLKFGRFLRGGVRVYGL